MHLQHGPIDFIVEAWGEAAEIEASYAQVLARFEDILAVLMNELTVLRTRVTSAYPLVRGPVAKRMVAAVWPHCNTFITPMAAVAGAVADELLLALVQGRTLDKAYVNDGGDIAIHLAGSSTFEVGVAGDSASPVLEGSIRLRESDLIRGVATSGWRGRSQSLGIADAVTVLAKTAAEADAAATLVANAVNIQHPAIRRLPARAVKEDSDLGDLPVTVEVGALPLEAVEAALNAGQTLAIALRDRGLIEGAVLSLNGKWRSVPPLVAAQVTARC